MKRAWVEFKGKTYPVTVEEEGQLLTEDGNILKEEEVVWLPPKHGTIIALGLNYADHASELAFKTPPKEPLIFVKPPSATIGHCGQSYRPDHVDYMHYEGELVAVVGKTACKVKREEAMDFVRGYTICNDYAVRDYLENYYRPNLRVKGRDTLTPLGPWIIDKEEVGDPSNLTIRTYINDEVKQKGNTRDMIFDIPFLIEYLSAFMTLQPGDMISTGTPKGLADVQPGDTVVTEIEKIGRLENRVVSEQAYFETKG